MPPDWEALLCVCARVCVQLIVYTTENEFRSWHFQLDENVPAVCQKGRIFKNRKFTSNV